MPAKSVQRKPSTKDVSTPSNFVHTSAGTETPSVSFSKATPNPYYYNAPTTPVSKPGKFFSSIKSWGKSNKSGRSGGGPRESVQQSSSIPPSSSAGSNLTSAFDWDSSSNMSYSSPDTSPEAKRRSPPRKPLNAVFSTERSGTPPPQSRLDDTSKQTTQSPPFDLSFERAAAVPLIESRSSSNSSLASNARLQPLTLDLPTSLAKARIPSMRFDDLTVFFRDLEEKLAFKAGEVGAMDAQVLVQKPNTTVRKGLRHPQHSEIQREEAAEELRQLMSQKQLAGPSSAKTHERSVSASSLPYSMGPDVVPMPVSVAPLKKAKKQIPEPIALPQTLLVPEVKTIGTPRQTESSFFSPRLSSQSSLGAPFSNPPELQIQPPTPILDTGLFPLPPSRPQRTSIPARQSSRSPSPPISPKLDLEEPIASTNTPPLSPSSSSSSSAASVSSASPRSTDFPRSTSIASIASEASDVRFSTLLDSLQQAVAPREKEQMTEENLALHQSALSSLVDQAINLASTQLDEESEVEELDWSEDEEEEGTCFDDAPSLRSSPSSQAVLVHEQSDLASYMSSSSLATTVSVGSLRSKKSDGLLVRRRTRHAVKDSLGDIDEAVVVMCDRIEVGMAM